MELVVRRFFSRNAVIKSSHTLASSLKLWNESPSNSFLQSAQDDLLDQCLSNINTNRFGRPNRTAQVSKVYIKDIYNNEVSICKDESELYINELKILRDDARDHKECNPLVMLPGFATGLACFGNVDELTSDPIRSPHNLFAIDLLGSSLSQHRSFGFEDSVLQTPRIVFQGDKYDLKDLEENLAYIVKTTRNIVQHHENYYIQSIENWRIANNINSMNLLGHSFGGYLSLLYALKYPNNVNKLILAAPLGIEQSVYSMDYIENYLGKHTFKEIPFVNNNSSSYENASMVNRRVLWCILKMWDYDFYPFKLARILGPLGTHWIANYFQRRFTRSLSQNGTTSKDELTSQVAKLVKYHVALVLQDSPLEHSIARIFCAQGRARVPLSGRRGEIVAAAPFFPPTLWIHGEWDHLVDNKSAHGFAAALLQSGLGRLLDHHRDHHHQFALISNAGHNMFLDNPQSFNQTVLHFLSH